MQNKIKYIEYDIDNTEGRKMFNKLGGGGIPLILIGSKKIRGFNPREILIAVNQAE